MKEEKILLVGDDSYEMYVKAFYNSFQKLGYKNVSLFATNRYMESSGSVGKLLMRIQNKLAYGCSVTKVNKKLLETIKAEKPELAFLYSSRLIYPKVIKQIKDLGCKVFMYNNDNPFAPYFPKYFWRHYLGGLRYADYGFVYRHSNVEDYKKSGCENVELLRSYYIEERNFYVEHPKLVVPEVIFLGHHEPDEREGYIRSLLKQNISVGVMQKSWEDFEPENPQVVKLADSHKYYNEMLNAAKIALVFLSKINHDTYTRRCFEIPAVKTMMVAPYTEDIAAMFEDGKEVVLYKNEQEFAEKVKYYLEHEDERLQIANAGYERVMRDGHEVCDRIKQVMLVYEKICEEKR